MHRPDSPRLRRFARGLGSGACFAAAFAASVFLTGREKSFPKVPAVFAKRQYFAENADRFDTIFIGSSRVFYQVDPQQFDTEVAALGGHAQSVNLACSGMWPPESFYFLRQILALHPARLRWVFIEIMPVNASLETRNDQTLRTAYWHDWRHTRMACEEIMAPPRAPVEKARLLIEHAAILARWNLHLGTWAAALRERVLPEKPERPPSWIGRLGFQPQTGRQIPAADLPAYLRDLEHLRRHPPPTPASALYTTALRDLADAVRRAGAEPVFILTPTLYASDVIIGLPDGVPVFSFSDPVQYPALYAPEHHYDSWHLNEKGAAEFTSLLALRFAEHLRGAP